jgi:hypothetical protein
VKPPVEVVDVAYRTELVTVLDEMRGWFSKIVARKTGDFTVFQYATRLLDISKWRIILRPIDWWISVHERMAFTVKTFVTNTDSD